MSLSFPISGKLKTLPVSPGQSVQKGLTVATLDPTQLQAYLDRALHAYDKERASFDKEMEKNPDKDRTRLIQNDLDIAVKNVEIAKANVDDTTLITPISGFVDSIEPEGIVSGIFLTPSKFSITIVDTSSLLFVASAHEQERTSLSVGKSLSVSIPALGKVTPATVLSISVIPTTETYCTIRARLQESGGLSAGLSADGHW